VSISPPDRAIIAATVMDELIAIRVDTRDETVGVARIVAATDAVVAGTVVVREIMGRVGVRTRSLVREGARAAAGTAVLELGGPLAAIRGAAPLALTWVTRCGAVASGAMPPEEGNPIDAYASRLSAAVAVGHDEPSFRLEIDGDTRGVEG
jgi:Quinolinate phosphoribosyl transferase, N-terminal domain